MNRNDFIILGRTTCYFIEGQTNLIQVATIIKYDNYNGMITLRYKQLENYYTIIYRPRNRIWFDLKECLLFLVDYIKGENMYLLEAMNLSDQLDGSTNILSLEESIGDRYTIYLNGLRQNREDYIVDNTRLELTMLIDPIPNQDDILTIEWWKNNAA